MAYRLGNWEIPLLSDCFIFRSLLIEHLSNRFVKYGKYSAHNQELKIKLRSMLILHQGFEMQAQAYVFSRWVEHRKHR